MKKPIWALGFAALLLAGCAGTSETANRTPDGFIQELPQGVLAIVAPYQDLTAVKIDPADGCYVYRYIGPVETTYLPLRSTEGRPICSRLPEDAATATG